MLWRGCDSGCVRCGGPYFLGPGRPGWCGLAALGVARGRRGAWLRGASRAAWAGEAPPRFERFAESAGFGHARRRALAAASLAEMATLLGPRVRFVVARP